MSSPEPGDSSNSLPKSPSGSAERVSSPTRRPIPKTMSGVGRGMTGNESAISLKRRGSISSRRMSKASLSFAHVDSTSSIPCEELDEIDQSQVPWWTSQRLQLAIISFFGFVFLYAQRVNLSITIVSMVDTTDYHHENTSFPNLTEIGNMTDTTSPFHPEDEKCPALSKSESKGEFRWSKPLVGLILGSFFWGYLVLQVPGGRLSERYGAKRVVAICMFPVAILNILTPVAARIGPYALLVLRVFVGLGEGVMYPAAQALWSCWAPPTERSRLIGFSYAGGQFGNAAIFPIGGYLSAYGFDGGWPSVFYVIGSCGFIWCVVWSIFAYDTPDANPRITDIEKQYINYSLGKSDKNKIKKKKKVKAIPWKAILTSRAVWAILVAHMCGNYGIYMLLTKIPGYMKDVLKFDIKSNGVFSMLPYLAFWACITVSGIIADKIISKEIFSIQVTRKIMTVIGMILPAAFLIGTGFMECDQRGGAIVMLTISVGLCGFHFSGFFINHADIAPPFAGTLFGITNTMATIPGILSPYIVSAMTPHGTREEWLGAFYVAAAIYVFGATWYVILGQGEVQPWAMDKEDEPLTTPEDVGFELHKIGEIDEEDHEEENDNEKGKMLLSSLGKEGNGEMV